MAKLTYFVALRFDRNDEGEFRVGDAQECPTAGVAIDRAGSMHQGAGAIAFSRTGDPATGEFEAAEILQQFGDVPRDDLLRGYEDPEITLKEIVKVLDISQPLVEHRMNIGDLPSRNVGNDRCVRLSDVLALKEKIDEAQRTIREIARIAEESAED